MGTPIVIKLMVVDARYVEEADSILIVGEHNGKKIYPQLHSSDFLFGSLDKKTEMTRLAKMLVGRRINYVSDPDLEDKIKTKYPLKYEKVK